MVKIMRRRNNKNNRREKILMVTASALVLGLLTTTGLVLREQPEDDNVIIDFSALADENPDYVAQNEESTQEANSGTVLIPALDIESVEAGEVEKANEEEESILEEEKEEVDSGEVTQVTIQPEEAVEVSPTSAFTGSVLQSGDTLQWPIVGNVLINYSMDQTTYFQTLNQYKYNPAIIIAATEGELITSASAGIVERVFYHEEIGNAIEVKIDDTYTIIYGQLNGISVADGDIVDKGTILGEVASPTIYYAKEGCNVYFELRENGEPIDPMSRLE